VPQAKPQAEPQAEPLRVPQAKLQIAPQTEPQDKPQAKPQLKLQAQPLTPSPPIQPPLSSLLNSSPIHFPSSKQSPTSASIKSEPNNSGDFRNSRTLFHPDVANASSEQPKTTTGLTSEALAQPLSTPQFLSAMTYPGIDILQDKSVDEAKQNSSMTPAPHSVQKTVQSLVQSPVHPVVQPISYSAVDSQPDVPRSQHQETEHPGGSIIPSVRAKVSLGKQRQRPSPALPRSQQAVSIQPPIAPTSSTIYYPNRIPPSPTSPTITVTIGRIEVQVTRPTPPKPPSRSSSAPPSGPRLSLAEYLRRRNTQKGGGLA
jgi:hypothetical protein